MTLANKLLHKIGEASDEEWLVNQKLFNEIVNNAGKLDTLLKSAMREATNNGAKPFNNLYSAYEKAFQNLIDKLGENKDSQ